MMELENRGFKVRWLTWRAISARPYKLGLGALEAARGERERHPTDAGDGAGQAGDGNTSRTQEPEEDLWRNFADSLARAASWAHGSGAMTLAHARAAVDRVARGGNGAGRGGGGGGGNAGNGGGGGGGGGVDAAGWMTPRMLTPQHIDGTRGSTTTASFSAAKRAVFGQAPGPVFTADPHAAPGATKRITEQRPDSGPRPLVRRVPGGYGLER